jgi:altronate dehydratase
MSYTRLKQDGNKTGGARGYPRTVRAMSKHIDVGATGILRRGMATPEIGNTLIETILRTASGCLTAAEARGHGAFAPTRRFFSA